MVRTLKYFISYLFLFIGCLIVDKRDFARVITNFVKIKISECGVEYDNKNIL